MTDDLYQALDSAHVSAHDSARILLALQDDGVPPENLCTALRTARLLLADALRSLEDAAPIAAHMRESAP